MMPGNIFRLQIAAAFASKRTAILRIGVTVLLSMPFIFVAMPEKAKAAGIVMVIMFTTFFGSAVTYVRLRDDSRLERLLLLPASRFILWLDMVLAALITRILPTIVVVAGFVVINGRSVTIASVISLVAMLCVSLILLTVLGIGAGNLARNNAEVHLFGALICAVLAFVSGVTPLPQRLAWLEATTVGNPVAHLLLELNAMATVSPAVPRAKLVFSSLMLGIIAVLVFMRWVSSRCHGAK